MRISDLSENRTSPPNEKALKRLKDTVRTLEHLHNLVPTEHVEARYFYRIQENHNLNLYVRANGNRTYAKIYAIGQEFTIQCSGQKIIEFAKEIVITLKTLKDSIELVKNIIQSIEKHDYVIIDRKNSPIGTTNNTCGLTVYRYKPLTCAKIVPSLDFAPTGGIRVYFSGTRMRGYAYNYNFKYGEVEKIDRLIRVINGLMDQTVTERILHSILGGRFGQRSVVDQEELDRLAAENGN